MTSGSVTSGVVVFVSLKPLYCILRANVRYKQSKVIIFSSVCDLSDES